MKAEAVSLVGLRHSAWLGILEKVFGVPIKDKMDSIDIAWEGLSRACEGLDEREKAVLKMRFDDRLSLSEIGLIMPRRDKGVPITKQGIGITKERVRGIEQKAIRRLRHPSRIRIFQSCIAGIWNLYV